MPKSSIARNVKATLNGMRGVHLVAAELARGGFAPVLTMRNTAFADILAQPLTFDGAPLSISVKYSGVGVFFLLGKKSLPTSDKAFLVLVLERKKEPIRMWVVPSRTLAKNGTQLKTAQVIAAPLQLQQTAVCEARLPRLSRGSRFVVVAISLQPQGFPRQGSVTGGA
jgi:hypothetical protein